MCIRYAFCWSFLLIATFAQPSQPADANELAEDTQDVPGETDSLDASDIPTGHSQHGATFNEGPRQSAYLMGGTGKIRFPVSTKVPEVQKFIEQGIGQVHGFWYFEAERSFRHAAKLDPSCAIAYWGMALANASNGKRGKGFIAEAVKRKTAASPRELMYINALSAYLNESDKKKRANGYLKAMKQIIAKFPDDIEAKAQRGYMLYKSRALLKLDYKNIDMSLKEILAIEPMHPVHHYRIHLWDHKDSSKALDSAAACGLSAPSVAHMWHMPGHIYSHHKRYADSVFHQEASARVDHAQMMRDRVLPDQIHNFAHNNEWLVRSLAHVGRWRDAVELAKNMVELPRHPRYNTLKKRGSANYGRTRLFSVLRRFEQWQELIRLAETPYLEPTGIEEQKVKQLAHLGIAYAEIGQADSAQRIIAELESLKSDVEASAKKDKTPKEQESDQQKPADTASGADEAKQDAIDDEETKSNQEPANDTQAEEEPTIDAPSTPPTDVRKKDSQDAEKKKAAKQMADKKAATKKKDAEKKKVKQKADAHKARIQRLVKAIALIKGHVAVHEKNYRIAVPLLERGSEDKLVLARVQCLAGQKEKGVKTATDFMKKNGKRVQLIAGQIEVLWLADKKGKAAELFNELRGLSGMLQRGTPVFDRLDPIAGDLGLPKDWRYADATAADIGQRPTLESLGPFRWKPSLAADWSLKDHLGRPHTLKQYRGRPVVVIFYLGAACLHCAEQLQSFAPMAEEFKKAGISVIAISTDEIAGLKESLDSYEGAMPFPLVSNAKLDVFKAYRAYDDFENIALHGTFLIDGDGRIRWQDVSYQPFMEPKFLLTEAKRLLAQHEKPPVIVAASPPPARPKGFDVVKRSRIDPSGIAGSLFIAGNDIADADWQVFMGLAQGKKARLVVLRTDATAGTHARITKLVAQANLSDAASVVVLRVEVLGDFDDKAIAAVKDATAAWFAGDDGAKLRRLVADTAIERECRALVARGGVLGGAASSLSLMSRFRFTDRSTNKTADDGLAFLPNAMIDVVSVTEDHHSRLPGALAKRPNTIGFEIDSNAALVVRGRWLRKVGQGSVRLHLPPSETRKAKLIVLDGPRATADLTSLRRAAANRVDTNFPPVKMKPPIVERGTLIAIGGGGMPAGIMKKFVELAGGTKASIVVLPTAVPDPVPATSGMANEFRKLGVKNVTVLRGRTLDKVESDEYLKALENATGVWFGGGRQWRFVDAYAETKAEKLLHEVLARDGVIMGSSAGASIQAEYLARGNPLGNLDIMAEGYERGLGFLKGAAIDQHFSQRKRFADMAKLVSVYPQILGIGIDESTALIVHGRKGEVTGRGGVHFFDAARKPRDGDADYETVGHGGAYDLADRKVLKPGRPSPLRMHQGK